MTGHTWYTALPWLPAPPADLSARLKALSSVSPASAHVRAIARLALDDNQLAHLASAVRSLRDSGEPLQPLQPIRLGIASSSTMDFAITALEGTAPRHSLLLDCIDAGFGLAMQSALDPVSPLQAARPEIVLLALDTHWLLAFARHSQADASQSALQAVRAMLEGFRAGCGATCLVQTIPRPAEPLFGSLDRSVASTPHEVFDRFNRGLVELVRENAGLLIDIAALAENVGLANWHDPSAWGLAKSPFAHECLPIYADWVCRVIAAAYGKSRKCLVLDLDNTLWSGVVGDEGVEGIVVGEGDATGEAHLEVHRFALDLRDRGVVLAVCSKNDDGMARRAFREHAGMLLREEHFAVFQANWSDKASNLKAIATQLDLGLDALVFVDDNPVERALVRETLPEVAVPELPEDPAMYARTVAAAGYFESVNFSEEDLQRARSYADNARRVVLRETVGDLDEFLRSLQMVISLRPFDELSRARVTQLINKSNQFNLTTRRYTEAQVRQLAAQPGCETLQVRLRDRFGDNGMISVVICRRRGDDWEIDTWLMSCRVLGRKVEDAVLAELVQRGRRMGVSRLLGTYIPSARNALVKDHYDKLGFRCVATESDGSSRWMLELARYSARELPFTVQDD